MPLIKSASKEAFAKNFAETKVNTRTGEERPIAQRLAIAYAEQRRARKKSPPRAK